MQESWLRLMRRRKTDMRCSGERTLLVTLLLPLFSSPLFWTLPPTLLLVFFPFPLTKINKYKHNINNKIYIEIGTVRVVNLSSEGHRLSSAINFPDLKLTGYWFAEWRRYGQSKV